MRVLLAALLIALAGCASQTAAPVSESTSPTHVEAQKTGKPGVAGEKFYTVKKGDTVSNIAREHKLNPNDLVAWNKLDSTARIAVGQQLRLAPIGAATASVAPVQNDIEVRPIAGGGPVVARPLEGAATAVTPAPTSAPVTASLPAVPPPAVLPPVTSASTVSTNTEILKRDPKGSKLPYSEENLVRLRGRETPLAAPPVAAVTAPPLPADKSAEKPAMPAGSATSVPAGDVEWGWPVPGKVLAGYSEGGSGQETNKGLDLAGKMGDPVVAAAAGKVIYVGTMPKYGNLVVVLHAGAYSSVYAHNSKIVVKEAQVVTRGQKLAELGDSDADQPKLHFEVRQQGKPLDPLKFLPAR